MLRATFLALILVSLPVFSQTETIDNRTVVEMSKAGLAQEVILKKIASSHGAFDVTAQGLIALKNDGVDDTVIAALMVRAESVVPTQASEPSIDALSESGTAVSGAERNTLATAKTIAFGKSSLQPSRQALEKELLKRKDFRNLNLTILRYKEQADLYVDIGFVSGSWFTHRYVYRIYDRRSGAVIIAGETTSWGSLAENLARHISKRLVAARAS
jgi:hypothetical protein